MKPNTTALIALCLSALPIAAIAIDWIPMDCPSPRPAQSDLYRMRGPLPGGAVGAAWVPNNGEQNAQAAVVLESGTALDGGKALRVDWRFTGRQSLEYVEINTPPLTFDRLDSRLAIPIRSDSTALIPCFRFTDPSGETYQYYMDLPHQPGWQSGIVDLSIPAGHWGGDKDGIPQTPLTLHSVLFDRPTLGYVGTGRLWLGNFTEVERLAPGSALRIEAEAPPFGHLYEPGATVRLRGKTDRGMVRWELFDGHGEVLAQGGGTGTSATAIATLPNHVGHYTFRFTSTPLDAAPACKDFMCAVLDREKAPTDTWAGFSVHWVTGWPLEGMVLLPRYAVNTVRDEISWANVELNRGNYSINDRQRHALAAYASNGIKPLMILDYGNPLYDHGGFPNSPEAIAGYAGYAAWMARTVGPQVLAFEIWNEWVGGCSMEKNPGDHSPAAYGPLCKATHNAIKAVDSNLTVVAVGGENGPMVSTVATMMDHGAVGDAYSVHPYRYPAGPESSDLAGDITRMCELLRSRHQNERVWASEIGWPTQQGSRGVDLPLQARYTSRALAILWGTGTERVFWYDFKDDGLNLLYNEDNFGLVLHEKRCWAPKPAMVAFAAFNRRTAGAKHPRLIRQGDAWLATGTFKDGRQVVIAWSEKPDTIWTPAGTVERSWDMFNAPFAVTPTKLGPSPIFLFGKNLIRK